MESYGKLLKNLIKFTGSKLSAVAEAVGYDESYISKWCSQSKLPAQKVSSIVNLNLASFFSNEITLYDDLEAYRQLFDKLANKNNLEQSLHLMLKKSYQDSYSEMIEQQKKSTVYQPRILAQSIEIYNFFYHEFPEFIESFNEPVDIYCTLDVCQFLKSSLLSLGNLGTLSHPIKVHMGLKTSRLLEYNYEQTENLYYLINKYSQISFDFYDDSLMENMNTLIVKNKIAVICSLDQYSRCQAAAIITEPSRVKEIYQNVIQAYKSNKLLIHTAKSSEFYSKSYRTDFYAQNKYQILLTRGFEYLLPSDCMDSIEVHARETMNDEVLAVLIQKLKIIWEEMFEHGVIDFFTLKSSLIKYLEDGIIIITDVVYHMSVEERRKHIDNVLRIIDQNPNIRFYVIDDEYIPDAGRLIHTSVFSNYKKTYLKNPQRYFAEQGPYFYSIHSENVINNVNCFFEDLKTQPFCREYDGEGVKNFINKYGSMVNRILSLND